MTDAGPAFRVGNPDMWMDYERLKKELELARSDVTYFADRVKALTAQLDDARAALRVVRERWLDADDCVPTFEEQGIVDRALIKAITSTLGRGSVVEDTTYTPQPKPPIDDDGDPFTVNIGGPPIVPPAKRNQP